MTPSGAPADPTLAEDLLLVLFQPGAGLRGTGAIAGENTLFYVLAGAVLADLALGGHVRTTPGRFGGELVAAVADNPPTDPILRSVWDLLAVRARGVQTVLAAVGPGLREPVLDRLVERGDIRRGVRRSLGLFQARVLEGDGGPRRAALVAAVRAVLVDGTPPTPRVAALAALLSGSGALPQLDNEIPWSSAVIARSKELEQGNWGAEAAASAVTRTVSAFIVSSVVTAVPVPKG